MHEKLNQACVLVIDDDPAFAEVIEMLLESYNYEVKIAHSGESGLKIARQVLPGIVFCDLRLDLEMDGYAVARALRQDSILQHTHLVALTGFSSEVHKAEAKKAGFDFYVAKPISLDGLENLIANLSAHFTRQRRVGIR